jgi:hypothetical protein
MSHMQQYGEGISAKARLFLLENAAAQQRQQSGDIARLRGVRNGPKDASLFSANFFEPQA